MREVLKNTPEFETIRRSPLGVLFKLLASRCLTSGKLIHALLNRQLVTKKKYEMWMVFGGQPIHFSLAEFREIYYLPSGEFPEDYDPELEPVIQVKNDQV